MPSISMQRSLYRDTHEKEEKWRPGGPDEPTETIDSSVERDPEAQLIRCPHCERHFYSGGEVSPEGGADEFDREHAEEMGFAGRTRKYDRDFDHYYGAGEASEADHIRHGGKSFAHGGRVDGAGKVDGIHHHPAECSHLAGGGVCRHLAPNRKRAPGEDYSDAHVRNFSAGGGVSFEHYLAQRHSMRGRSRKE
jgi:hypothetical protein